MPFPTEEINFCVYANQCAWLLFGLETAYTRHKSCAMQKVVCF